MSNSLKRIKTNENIQVYVRVRPTNERERLLRSMEVVEATTNRDIVVKQTIDTKMTKKYSFDRTFGQESKQCDVYSTVVAPLIEEVLAGYNCTVFAYGQTGTGKTHTMVGDETPTLSSSWEDSTDVGMIPRALSHLFDELRLMEVEFSMRISYLELYNEELSDLLSTSDNSQIRIFDDANKKGSIIVQGLEEIPVHNTSDVFKLLAKGQEKRKTASTLMNAQSSRSHTIFSMLVHIKENGIEGEELLKIGKLNLVDLAGSENITKSGNEKGVRTRETVNINQSLLTLGRVITALVERAPHIPYRESKLTRLLQESLGGRTKTSIIATISPGHKDLEETLSTLEYAHRAKNIQNKPEVNQKLTKKTVLKEYTEEIDRLKRDLMAARDKNGIYLAEETYNDMQYKLDIQNRELNEKMLHIKAIKDELASKQRLFHEVSLNLVEKTEELKLKDEKLNHTEKVLGKTKKDLLSTKKRYQEKKHLLENHVRTETVLSNQAYQLKDVAQKASNDTYELHNTIERRQKVDKDTKNACENFQDEIKLFLNNITIKLETLFNEFNFRSQTINSDIGKNIIEHNNVSSSTIEKIGMLMNLNKNSTEKSNVYLTKYENLLTELSDTQQLAIREMLNDIIEKENLHRSQSEQQITELIETLNCQKNTFNDKCSELLSHIQNNSAIINNFCSTYKFELETFSQKLLNDINENHTIVNQTIAQNNLSENNLLNIAEQLQKEIENIQQNNNKLKTTIPKFECTEEQIEKYNLNELENLENHRKLCNNNDMQLNEFVNSLGANLSENCCINENTIRIVSQNNNVHSNAVIEKINEIEIENTKQNAKTLETMQSHSSNLKAQQTSDQIEIVNNCQQLSESITNAFINFKDYELQYISLNDLLCKSITDYGIENKQDVLKCMQNVENFYKNGIKLYSPTGSTPIRTQYQYPQNLASTSPHERLIQRFWISNNDVSKLDCSTVTFNEDIENEFFDGIQNDCTSTFRATDNNDSKDDDKTLKEYTINNQNNVINVLKPIQTIMSVSANNIRNDYIETNKENLSD